MTTEEKHEFKQRCRDRWERAKSTLNWSLGPMATWKPVMTEQQQKAHEQHVTEHKLPF